MNTDLANDISSELLLSTVNFGIYDTLPISTEKLKRSCFVFLFDVSGGPGNFIDIIEIEEADDAAFTINNGPVSIDRITKNSDLIGVQTPIPASFSSFEIGFFDTKQFVRAKFDLTVGGVLTLNVASISEPLSLPS